MPDKIDKMIEAIAESRMKYSVVKVFRENPYLMDNRMGLALWIGKPEDALGRELDEMVDIGLLKRWGKEPGAVYAYTRDKEARERIDQAWPELRKKAHDISWDFSLSRWTERPTEKTDGGEG